MGPQKYTLRMVWEVRNVAVECHGALFFVVVRQTEGNFWVLATSGKKSACSADPVSYRSGSANVVKHLYTLCYKSAYDECAQRRLDVTVCT